jgi:hypothetical protein
MSGAAISVNRLAICDDRYRVLTGGHGMSLELHAHHNTREDTHMATTIIPVDQSKFTRIMVVTIEPKMALAQDEEGGWYETDIQATSRDGDEKQWNVQAVFSQPSKYGSRLDTAVYTVTITGPDPSSQVMEGERVEFDNLTVSVSDPTMNRDKPGRVKGGRVNWEADSVRSKASSGSYASAEV